MTSEVLMLTLLEWVKCFLVVMLILVILKAIEVYQVVHLKGTLLNHVKTQGQWLMGLFVAGILALALLVFTFHELAEFKSNYTELWKWKSQAEQRIMKLEK